jgi:diguanylate cyclase (GGDEF)-like protein
VSENPADSALAKLELTLDSHQHWAESIVAGILADEAPVEENLVPGAHMLCDFGKWYYSQAHSTVLTEQPLFKTLEKKHRALHDAARILLAAPAGKVKAEAYRHFSSASSDMTLHLRNLIEALLTNELTTDALTGIPNRRQMDEQLEVAIDNATNVLRSPACLALADLDHFKRINDTYGHGIGDEVLKAFSQLLITSMRDTDRIYRYGGEEFLIFMPGVDLEQAERVLDRLREKISRYPLHVDGLPTPLNITVSFGIAQVMGNEPLRNLTRRADEALYQAKSAGRNRVYASDGLVPMK